MSASETLRPVPVPAAFSPNYCNRVGVAALLTAAADYLFYDEPVGITLLAFALALAAAATLLSSVARQEGEGLTFRGAALLASLAPLGENVSALSVCVALAGLTVFALSLNGRLRRGLGRIASQIVLFQLITPFRFIRDFFRWRLAARRFGRRTLRFAAVAVWAMPLTLGAVFILLFGAANPLIDHWLRMIDLMKLLDLIQVARVGFWLFVLAMVWAYLRPRSPRFRRKTRQPLPATLPTIESVAPKAAMIEDVIFGKGAILRALIVFNALFAVQTVLDAAYLWGGVALPDGLTYAAYAHRGAYPLIATALLAAGFVLAALRPGSATSKDRTIRLLVYIWVGQNLMLVISSILRLDLYVDVYALTYWRVAAFIWMGLVAAGLVLIVARIALEKSNGWLSSANLVVLAATLYACCFVNFAGLIASYNVDHSREMSGQGIPLDIWYLQSLGPNAFPAMDRMLARYPDILRQDYWNSAPEGTRLAQLRETGEVDYRRSQRNWRAWSFRDWRLLRYLDGRQSVTLPSGSENLMHAR